MSGYEVMEQIAEETMGKWKPSLGGIYPILHRLESKGYIELEKNDGGVVKRYSLTKQGEERFAVEGDSMRHKKERIMGLSSAMISVALGDGPDELHNSVNLMQSAFSMLFKVHSKLRTDPKNKWINAVEETLGNITQQLETLLK